MNKRALLMILIIAVIAVLVFINESKEEVKEEVLEEKPMKGLELYVRVYDKERYYSLFEGTNRTKTAEELADLTGMTTELDKVKEYISGYEDVDYLGILHDKSISKEEVQALIDELSGLHENWSISAGSFEFKPETYNQLMTDSVTRRLETVMSSPKESSNTNDYIEKHREDYDALLALDEYHSDLELTKHLLGMIHDMDNFGLKENIIMALRGDIIGEGIGIDAEQNICFKYDRIEKAIYFPKEVLPYIKVIDGENSLYVIDRRIMKEASGIAVYIFNLPKEEVPDKEALETFNEKQAQVPHHYIGETETNIVVMVPASDVQYPADDYNAEMAYRQLITDLVENSVLGE